MRRNCKTFEQWIESMYQDYCVKSCNAHNLHCDIHCNRNTVSCCISNTRKNWNACERVKYDGSFEKTRKKAIALTWAAYCDEDVPVFKKLLHVRDIKDGDFFEESNGKEWIKIGYNPRTNEYVCVALSGRAELCMFDGACRVYKPQ